MNKLFFFISFFAFMNSCIKEKAKSKLDCYSNPRPLMNAPCPANYDPVCGCDSVTYSNECEARNAGITNWKKGTCKK